MAESLPMSNGDGTYSYSKNSKYQKAASDSTKELIKEAILEKLDIIPTTFCIADLGCSIGPNTFFIMQDMIEAVQQKHSSHIEFQVFFNDQTNNDFNTLFASLPKDRQYYAMGVPGSFYNRLFPRASITLAHSSYAVHWLSGFPERLSDPKSVAWNEGKIHCTGAPQPVLDAYAEQFEKDMGVFLSARAEEIIPGGLMFVIILGCHEGLSHYQLPLCSVFEASLMDIADEGIIEKAAIDRFNLPLYATTVVEMTKIIENNGCFSIEGIELTNPLSRLLLDGSLNAHTLIAHVRAAMGGIFTTHFGHEVADKMFQKTLAKFEENYSRFLEGAQQGWTHLFLVLKRN